MFQTKTKIFSNIQVTENYFKMCLDASAIAQKAQPGQFIYVRVNDKNEPLLRRALSIHRISHQSPELPVASHQLKNKEKSNLIEILYKIKGIGTKILSEKKAGEELDIIGPLGNGFNLSAIRPPSRAGEAGYSLSAILVAGGIGVAPLIFLAEKLTRNLQPATRNPILVLIGAKTKKEVLCKNDFEDLGCEVKVSTDDGTFGEKALVADLLKDLLASRNPQPATRIYACGPTPMLKEISKVSQQYKISAQISLEEKMACGIGVCHGCVTKVTSHQSPVTSKKTEKQEDFIYKRVCKDGPVFDAQEVIWG